VYQISSACSITKPKTNKKKTPKRYHQILHIKHKLTGIEENKQQQKPITSKFSKYIHSSTPAVRMKEEETTYSTC